MTLFIACGVFLLGCLMRELVHKTLKRAGAAFSKTTCGLLFLVPVDFARGLLHGRKGDGAQTGGKVSPPVAPCGPRRHFPAVRECGLHEFTKRSRPARCVGVFGGSSSNPKRRKEVNKND